MMIKRHLPYYTEAESDALLQTEHDLCHHCGDDARAAIMHGENRTIHNCEGVPTCSNCLWEHDLPPTCYPMLRAEDLA
ncbi:MAG: hypothetical protein ACE5FM_05930 [Methyloligellaceae bacterium]